MALTTTTINIDIKDVVSAGFTSARVRFALTGPDQDSADDIAIASVPPSYVTLDDTGVGTVALWPNDRGATGSSYDVTALILDPATKREVECYLGRVAVPSSEVEVALEDLLSLPAATPIGETILARVLAAAQRAEDAADEAEEIAENLGTLDQISEIADQVNSDAGRAEAARDEAIIAGASAGTYPLRSDALLFVAEGGYFWSPDGATAGYSALYRVVSGAAVAQGIEQPLKAVTEANTAAVALRETIAAADNYRNDAGIHAAAIAASIAAGFPDPSHLSALLNSGAWLSFTAGMYLMSGVTKADVNSFSQLVVTRAASAYALTAAGAYQLFAANKLRATDRGALIEGAATQLLDYPVDVSNAYWVKSTYATAAANVNGAPTGAHNSYTITENATLSGGCNFTKTIGTFAAGNYTVSTHLKKGGRTYSQLAITVGSTLYFGTLNFDTGVFTAVSEAGIAAPVSSAVVALANGWFRVSITVNNPSSQSIVVSVRGAGGTTYADRTYSLVSGTVAFQVAMLQLEAGLAASSPILTGGATRAADAVSLAFAGTGASDAVTVEYVGGSATLLRSALASSGAINLVTDGGAPWLTRYITSITMRPAQADTYRTLDQRDDDHWAALHASQIVAMRADLNRTMAKAGLGPLRGRVPVEYDRVQATENGCAPHLALKSGTYFWNGRFYGTQAAALAAAGATASGAVITFNGWTDGVNLIEGMNFGDFALASGPTLTASGAEWIFDNSGGYGHVYFNGKGLNGQALRFDMTARRGTIVSGIMGARASVFGSTMSSSMASSALTSTSDQVLSILLDARGGTDWWIGFGSSGGALGTAYIKDPKLYRVWPAENWPQSPFTMRLKGISGASLPSATQVLATGYTSGVRDYIRVEWATDGGLWLRRWCNAGVGGSTESNEAVQIGTLAAGGVAFDIAYAFTRMGMLGAINGAGASYDFSFTMGCAKWTFGADHAGVNAFGGTISSIEVFTGAETLEWCKRVTKPFTSAPATLRLYARRPMMWAFNGDSYSIGTSTGIGGMLADLGVEQYNVGVGGSTMAQQDAVRIANAAIMAPLSNFWWDGSPNGHTNGQIALEQGYINNWVSGMGHNRWLYVRSGQIPLAVGTDYSDPTQYNDMTALFNWIANKWGAIRVYDPWPVVKKFAINDPTVTGYTEDQADIAAGKFPRSATMDTIHLRWDVKRAVALDMLPQMQAIDMGLAA